MHTPVFPNVRPRRLRQTASIRALVRETRLDPGDLVLPLFFSETLREPQPVSTMPGVSQLPVSMAAAEARRAKELGLGGVILFGLPKQKDAIGSGAFDPNGPVARAVATMKDAAPELVVITDVCVDEYTDHGHCGVLKQGKGGVMEVDNDATLEILAKSALVHAKAGADIVAPSDMMDGRVGAIRKALDGGGFSEIAILSYAVKYASAFYGPFREAADCAPKFGDRAGYQMDPANSDEALREVALDLAEGADMVMVKPGMPYLDIVRRVKERFGVPTFVYQVSGEYAMLKAAGAQGWIDADACMMEALVGFRRAGADAILTYFAIDAAERLRDDGR
jgi:porphobilinogen synthase